MRRSFALFLAPLALLCSFAPASPLHAQTALPTTTVLTVSPGASSPAQRLVTLTAAVTDSGSQPVLHGSVTFYDGTVALGTVTMISNASAGFTPGTALFRIRSLAQGSHPSLTAVFNKTAADAASTSAPQALTITAPAGPYPSVPVISANGPDSSGNYALTSSVVAPVATPATGTLTVTNTSTGAQLGILNPASPPSNGPGNQTFTSQLPGPAGDCSSVAAGDFNNDGDLDWIAVSGSPDSLGRPCLGAAASLTVGLGKGDGTFQTVSTPVTVNSPPSPIITADFNGDGNLDVVIGAQLFLGNGDGTFQSPLSVPSVLATGDFNGDGIPDLAGIGTVLLGKGDGTFTQESFTVDPGPIPATSFVLDAPVIAVADMDGDGKQDLVLGYRRSVQVLLGNGDGTFQNPIVYDEPVSPQATQFPPGTAGLTLADLSGSGHPQIVWALWGEYDGYGIESQSILYLTFSAGTLSVVNRTSLNTVQQVLNPMLPGDFLLNGSQQIAIYNNDSGAGNTTLFALNSSGQLASTPSGVYVNGASPMAVNQFAVGDFLNAGESDVAVLDAATRKLYVVEPGYRTGFQPLDFTLPASCGLQQIVAQYSGDATLAPGTSAPLAFNQQNAATTSQLTGVPAAVATGTPFTVSAVVNPSCSGPAAPSGNETIALSGGATLATGALSGSPAAFSAPINTAAHPLPPGSRSILATYAGDSNWLGSSIAATVLVQGTVTLSAKYAGPATVTSGSPITITGQLSINQAGPPAPTGTVTLLDNGKSIATSTLSGSAPFALTFTANTASQPLPKGSNTLTLSYSGDTNWASATSNNVSVTTSVPNLTLTSSLGTYTSAVQGTPVTLTATASGSNGTPTGTVQFYIDSAAAGAPVPMSGGSASYTTSSLSPGQHTVNASYSGNSTYGSTTTNGLVTVVTQGSDSLQIAIAAPATTPIGTPVTITGTVAVNSLGPAPTGTVSLLDGSTVLSTASLTGAAPVSIPFTVNSPAQPLAPGSHSFSLHYAGSAQWAGSTSTASAVAITQAVTTAKLTSSADTADAGAAVTFTAAIASVLASPAPTGTVQFYDGSTALGSPAPLANGAASFSTTTLAPGSHSITAAYSGDTNFAPSTSPALTENIQGVGLSVSTKTGSIPPGGSATYTLAINSQGGLDLPTSFSCSGLPQGATCSFSPSTITGSGSTTLTIATTGTTAQLLPLGTLGKGAFFACVFLVLLPGRRRRQLFLFAIIACLPFALMGCGGGSMTSHSGGGNSTATPAGTYTVTVNATTGSGASALTSKTTLSLTVQ